MTRHQRPSDDLPTLAWQLRSSLDSLKDDTDGPDARDFRRFLRQAVACAWRAAATGTFGAVREVIDLIREARPVVDDALPKLSARAVAAVEVQQALAVLYVGEDELREVEIENRLADRGRHPTERAVLEVLASATRPLRQAEVHERLGLAAEDKPTPSRVGQILRELFDHGFTRRQLARARGRAEAAHYQLAPRGLALCKQLAIPVVTTAHRITGDSAPQVTSSRMKVFNVNPASKARLLHTFAEMWSPGTNKASWRLVSGLLQSAPNRRLGRYYLNELSKILPRSEGRVIADAEFARERGFIEVTQELLTTEVQLVKAQR